MSEPFSDEALLLTEAEQADLQAWVDTVKPMLALSHWEITVTRHAARNDAMASSFIRDFADISWIALAPECRTWGAVELRQNLTHEMLHPHFQRVSAMASRLIEKELGTRAEAIIEAAVRQVEEQSIDRLATAIAKFLPLPKVLKHAGS